MDTPPASAGVAVGVGRAEEDSRAGEKLPPPSVSFRRLLLPPSVPVSHLRSPYKELGGIRKWNAPTSICYIGYDRCFWVRDSQVQRT